MEFSRTEYPALLANLQPDQAITVLNDRVSLINKINSDIADWLQERRKIEEAYALSLRKLARRPPQDGTVVFGVFQMPWQRIVSSVENLAQSHENLATKIETDVESPLRQFANKNREMQALGTTQGNLNSIAKELGSAQKKADKLNAKGSRKADGASTSADDTSRQWESQAPYVFEQLQALDERRVNNLRDVLTQYQTHEIDQIERQRSSAESCLNALLNVETADEIKTFAARVNGARDLVSRRRSSAGGSTRPPTSSIQTPPTPPPPRLTEDRRNQRTNSSTGQDRVAQLQNNTAQKSKISGLKRFGTVLGRRKGEAPPIPPPNSEKRKTRSFAPFRRGDSSRSFQDLELAGQDLTPSITEEQFDTSERSQPTYQLPPINQLENTQQSENLVNGTSQTMPGAHGDSEATNTRSQLLENAQDLPPGSQQGATESGLAPTNEATSSHLEPTLSDRGPPVSELGEAGRNLEIRDQPIQEDESEAQRAMNDTAAKLRIQAQTSGMNRLSGTFRGRRDVRNTVYVPSNLEPQDVLGQQNTTTNPLIATDPSPITTSPRMDTLSPDIASPIKRSGLSGIAQDDQTVGSDSTSIHSARSSANIAHHPELHEPGLNASIVETVNTWFNENGVEKSFVVGEIALAYNSKADSDVDHETIRLQNFQVLEKVAANPTFITETKLNDTTSEEQAGCYKVGISAIRRSMPTVGFKYQLHIQDSNLAEYSPILLTPAWQILEGQVSVILIYKLNPIFASEESSTIILKNVTMSVNLDITSEGSGKPTSAMMAPTQGASFRRKAGAVVWRFNELSLKSTEERLLVRFAVQGGPAKKGSVEVKFELPGRAASTLGIEKITVTSNATTTKETDPFADEGGTSERGSAEEKRWESLPTQKMLISGRYSAS